MNRIIQSLRQIVGQVELNKILMSGRHVTFEKGRQLVAMFENVKKVYYVVEGCIGIIVEDRYSVFRDKLLADPTQTVSPADLIMSPEIQTDIEFRDGDFVLFEHALYEQYMPFEVACRSTTKAIELDGNLFKATFYGSDCLTQTN